MNLNPYERERERGNRTFVRELIKATMWLGIEGLLS